MWGTNAEPIGGRKAPFFGGPVAKGDRQDFCQICKKPVYRNRLTWRRVQYLQSLQQNYLHYSEYNSSKWSASVTPEYTAWGLYPDLRYPTYDSSYNVTWNQGLAAYDGTATVRTTSGVDVSAWTSLVFSAYVGHHQLNTTPELAITIGLCSEDGLTTQVLATFTSKNTHRIWATVTPAEITAISTSAVCVYVTVTGTGLWWFERAQLERDVVTPGRPVQTTGSQVEVTADRVVYEMAKVCPDCKETMSYDPLRESDPTIDKTGEWIAGETEVEA